ncbi:MAG: hypothetical protein AB7F19_02325 [Candidatus Babeliales bacterium]
MMIKRKFIWHKLKKNIYRQDSVSDKSIEALAIFLSDGLGFKTYMDFLLDEKRQRFVGNLSWLEKRGDMISIDIDDYVYPDTPIFTTTIRNLITILQEYRRLFYLQVNRIEITIDEFDQVSVTGE